jgi:pimeloyl-ACP methyl ester carboxylesterase
MTKPLAVLAASLLVPLAAGALDRSAAAPSVPVSDPGADAQAAVATDRAAGRDHAVGDWLGSLDVAPGVTLRLALHVSQSAPGSFAATWDSIDQGTFGNPAQDLKISADSLAFDVPQIGARYAASWDAAAGVWRGQWTQGGRALTLDLARGVPPPAPVVAGLDGDWDGALEAGGVKLRLALHIHTGPKGTTGTLDSIDQGSMGLVLSAISRDGASVRFELNAPKAGFEGTLSPDGRVLTGHWSQGGGALPLVLTRRAPGAPEAKLVRPQTPVKPYPYDEAEVTFDDALAHVRLAGTLTLPRGRGPFPAVVLVSGSGPNTRDEPILGHRIFLVLADHLTRAGVAVLRYDKRGVGASTGDYAHATTADFADDATAALAYLRARGEIDPKRVGLIGHSEGGLIVPMVADRAPAPAFIVMMAGPGVDGARILSAQGRLISRAMGMDESKVAAEGALRDQAIATVRAERDPAKAAVKLRALLTASAKTLGMSDAEVDAYIAQLNTDWFRYFFAYDPAPALRAVRCPVLAIAGSKDLQVPPEDNLAAIRAALAGNPDAQVVELPGLNHLFQTAKTGGLAEYGQIEETLAPAAMDVVTRWILARTRTGAA